MISKILGAIIGKRASQNVDGLGETGGALLGATAVPIMHRLGPLGIIAALAVGYALKRHSDKKNSAAMYRAR